MNNTAKRLFIEFLIMIIILICYGIFSNPHIFSVDIGGWMAIIGIGWIIGTLFLSLPFTPIDQSIKACLCGLILIIIGMITHQPSPKPSFTHDQIGSHPQSEWQIKVFYNQYNLRQQQIYNFTGTSEEANSAIGCAREQWNEENPQNPAIDAYKVLCYVPEEHLKENNYPEEYGERY